VAEQKELTRVDCYRRGPEGLEAIGCPEAAELIRTAPVTLETKKELPLVWIDIFNPGETEAEFLRTELGMHPLAVEDCLRGRQRPKIDRYPGYFFLVFYSTRVNVERRRMALNEVHLFLGSSFLITVHDQEVPELLSVIEDWKHQPQRDGDSGTAAYALLDSIVDNYFPVTEHFSNRLEALEDEILMSAPSTTLHSAIHLRQEMILLRRVLAPERDVLSSLVRRDLPFVRPELVPYFADVHDHILRVTEEIDSFRDLISSLLEVQSSNAANQLNQTMRALAGWSIILMSMALIAGIYGMNFRFMPELRLRWGYWGALALMGTVGLALLAVFRRREWL
jgi:magnesium transporter